MIDLKGPRETANALKWMLTLGKDNTEGIRTELFDLVRHTAATLVSVNELTQALFEIKKEDFNQDNFSKVYWYCTNNYTDSNAARLSRCHCTDIKRDIKRIEFQLSKIMRTEDGKWSEVDKAFEKVDNSDNNLHRI